MPRYEVVVKSKNTQEVLASGMETIGEAWDWMHSHNSDGYVTLRNKNS